MRISKNVKILIVALIPTVVPFFIYLYVPIRSGLFLLFEILFDKGLEQAVRDSWGWPMFILLVVAGCCREYFIFLPAIIWGTACGEIFLRRKKIICFVENIFTEKENFTKTLITLSIISQFMGMLIHKYTTYIDVTKDKSFEITFAIILIELTLFVVPVGVLYAWRWLKRSPAMRKKLRVLIIVLILASLPLVFFMCFDTAEFFKLAFKIGGILPALIFRLLCWLTGQSLLELFYGKCFLLYIFLSLVGMLIGLLIAVLPCLLWGVLCSIIMLRVDKVKRFALDVFTEQKYFIMLSGIASVFAQFLGMVLAR